MILDYNEAGVPATFECDICVIGSGAAALALLTRFYDSSCKVLVVEAGGEDVTVQNQQLYDVVAPYQPFPGATEGRFRVFGGSTVKWGGQALPLDELDFAKRTWVPSSGWPITRQEVAPYYGAVDEFLGVAPEEYEADMYALLREPKLPAEELKFRYSKWSPRPNLREKYRKQLAKSASITLLQNASVVAINLTDNHQAVQSVALRNFPGKEGCVQAKQYILACGGIENARLLLASNHQNPKGVGNDYDVVGRFLQDHPNAYIGTITNASKRTQRYFNYFHIGSTRCLPRYLLSEDVQKKNQLLNASASILFFSQEDSAYAQALALYRKQARGNISLQDVRTLVRLGMQLNQLAKPITSMLLHRKVYTPNPSVKLNLMMETPPEWDNRVKLTAKYDALGLPIASVEWRLNDQVRHTLRTCAALFARHFPLLGLGELQMEEWVEAEDWAAHLKDAYHHIGTTRMSNTPHEGVVDSNCQVFGVKNLYVAGSSVFPTSGHSNPTATLIALAFRLADHLKTAVA